MSAGVHLRRSSRTSARFAAQRGAQLNAIVVPQHLRHPLEKHPDSTGQVAVLGVDDVERGGLGKPVTQHEVESAALHGFLENKSRNLCDTQSSLRGGDIT